MLKQYQCIKIINNVLFISTNNLEVNECVHNQFYVTDKLLLKLLLSSPVLLHHCA